MTHPSAVPTPTHWDDVPALAAVPEHVTLIFDGACDFCSRSVRIIRALDRRGRVTPIPFQREGIPAAYGLTVADCEHAAWVITPDDRHYPAAAAINVALSAALGTRLLWLGYRLPGSRWLQDRVYAWVARNRTRFPGDTPHCQQHPEACA